MNTQSRYFSMPLVFMQDLTTFCDLKKIEKYWICILEICRRGPDLLKYFGAIKTFSTSSYLVVTIYQT